MAQGLPHGMGDMRHDGRQHQHHRLQGLLHHGATLRRVVLEFIQGIDEFHVGGDGGIEGITPPHVVADFDDGLMQLIAHGTLRVIELRGIEARRLAALDMSRSQFPQPLQKALRAVDTGVVPFQGHLRRRGEHHEQAHGIGAVAAHQVLGIDAVLLRLGHGADAAVLYCLAVVLGLGRNDLALVRRVPPPRRRANNS